MGWLPEGNATSPRDPFHQLSPSAKPSAHSASAHVLSAFRCTLPAIVLGALLFGNLLLLSANPRLWPACPPDRDAVDALVLTGLQPGGASGGDGLQAVGELQPSVSVVVERPADDAGAVGSEAAEWWREKGAYSPTGRKGGGTPRLAYGILGAKNDSARVVRLLLAIYHPLNHYAVHIDDPEETLALKTKIAAHPALSRRANIVVIPDPEVVTYQGSTLLSATLRLAHVHIASGAQWDWFINLSAADYPLMSQDDMLYLFSHVDRSLSFMDHSVEHRFDYRQRAVNLDRALFQAHRGHKLMRDVRPAATRFHVFMGCNWIKASRPFLRYVLWEPASWPRRILMYMADVIDSDEHYFSTVACHSARFNHSLLNASLHFATFAKGSPHSLEMNDSFYEAFTSGVFLFARKFPRDSPTLDRIDRELLQRQPDSITPGAWCSLPPSTASPSTFHSPPSDGTTDSTSGTTSSSSSSGSGSGSSSSSSSVGVTGWLQRLLSPAPCNPHRGATMNTPSALTPSVVTSHGETETNDKGTTATGGDNSEIGAGCPSTVNTALVASLVLAPSKRAETMLPRFLKLLDTSNSCRVPEGDARLTEGEWKDGEVLNIEKYQI
ncbi:unnamed protein product [Closterium sp. Yama58-4]|nr:unnamed protein product [Closterium sp. Yama58-4]